MRVSRGRFEGARPGPGEGGAAHRDRRLSGCSDRRVPVRAPPGGALSGVAAKAGIRLLVCGLELRLFFCFIMWLARAAPSLVAVF